MSLPYDPEGANPLNLQTESKRLSDTPNKRNCIIPTYAPFYRTDFILTTPEGQELYEGMDFFFGHYYEELSKALQRPVFGSIVLVDPSIDEVVFRRYKSVGGPHLAQPSFISKYLVDPELTDPRSTDWSVVIQRVIDIEVHNRPESIDEAIEIDSFAKAMNGLKETVKANIQTKNIQMTDLIAKLEALSKDFADKLFERHVQDTGQFAHVLDTAAVNAANRSDTAPNTVYLHGAELEESLVRMRAFLFQHSDLAYLVNRSDAELLGVIALATGVSIICDNGLRIEHTNDALTITNGKSVFRINIAKAESGRAAFYLQSHGNSLSIKSTESNIFYNSLPILTDAEAKDYLNPNLGRASQVFTANTTTVTLSGDGESYPLRGDVKVARATMNQVGRFTVADDYTYNSVASAGWMYDFLVEVNAKADSDFTINGVPYAETVELTKSNIGANNVDNTPPADKALNNAFVTALGGKSRVGHKHEAVDVTNPRYANGSVTGYVQYAETLTDSATLAAQYNLVRDEYVKLITTDINLEETLNQDYIGGHAFVDISIREEQDENGTHRIIISDFKVLEAGSYTDIQGATFTNLSGTVSVVNGALVTTNVGKFVISRINEVVSVYSEYFYLMTRGWLEHRADPLAHEDMLSQGIYSLLENYPIARVWNNPNINPLDSWERWSHDPTLDNQPARSDELLWWGYTDNMVTSHGATSTYVTLLANFSDDYEFETLVTFEEEARDAVSVVMGAWVDTEGVQRTISLVMSSRVTSSSAMVGLVEVWADYYKPTARRISILDTGTETFTWSEHFAHVKLKYTGGQFHLSYVIGDVVGDKVKFEQNLEYELRFLGLNYTNRVFSLGEFTDNLPSQLRFGIGTRGCKGARFNTLTRPDQNLFFNYAAQSYMKAVAMNQTPVGNVTQTETEVTFTSTEVGVYTATLNTSERITLDKLPEFPNKVDYDYADGSVTITVTALNKDRNGTSLYEPPANIGPFNVSAVEISI